MDNLAPHSKVTIPSLSMSMRVVAALLAATAAYVLGHWVFLEMPFTTDENSYVFQAHNFLDGRIARPAPPATEAFFHPMIICDDKVGWLSRYPPGHSLWLVPGVLLGDARLMSALAAGLSIWLLTGCALLLNIPMLAMMLVLLASPYFLFVHGSLLSHTSGIMAVSFMLWAYIKWTQSERWGYAALAGLAWSVLLLNRSYTALLFALPFGVDALWQVRRRRCGITLVGVSAFALCAVVGIGLFLAYNRMTTGNLWLTPYDYYAPGERLGFGPRIHFNGLPYTHELSIGWAYLIDNVRLLNRWLFGFKGSLLVALGLALVGWSRRWSPLWFAVVVLAWLGHMAFWYPGSNDIGPYYYFETFPFLALMVALGLTRLWRWVEARRIGWRIAFVVMAGLEVAAALAFMAKEGRRIQAQLRPDYEFAGQLHSAPADALVAISPDMPARMDMLAFNPRGLDSRPLILRPYDDAVQRFLHILKDRRGYRLGGDGGRKLVAVEKTPLNMVFDPVKSHRLTGGNEALPDGRIVRAARASQDAGQMLTFGQYVYLYAGRFAFEADLVWSNVLAEIPASLDVAADSGRRILVQRSISGHGNGPVRLELAVAAVELVEPRIYYSGSGDVIVRALRIKELKADTVP